MTNLPRFEFAGWLAFHAVWVVTAENIVFPHDVVINVRNAPYGAQGDGVSDDTLALQSALSDGCGKKVVYLPNGTYLIHDTLRFHCLGPMLYGQSRDGPGDQAGR